MLACQIMTASGLHYGGILPYALVGGQLWLLLGREMRVDNWSGSQRWSPFGGGVDPGESGWKAALREGYEETMGLFGTPKEMAKRVDRKPWRNNRHEYTLLMPVEYDRNIPRYFRNFYRYAKRCKGKCPEGWFEKTEVRWVRWEQMRHMELRPEFTKSLSSLKRHLNKMLGVRP